MRFRFRGKARPTAAEVNRWNMLVDQKLRGEARKAGSPNLKTYNPSSRVGVVKNTSGSDRAVFDCMSIDDTLLWDLETDGTADVVFKLITADPDKAPAVLLEPIENNGFGKAILDGLAIAKVGGGSGMVGTLDASNHRIVPEAGGSIKILAAPHATDLKILPVILNAYAADNCLLIKTPGGGIAAASGTGPYTFGSATCTIVAADGTVGSDTVTVKNIVNQAIAANVMGKAERYGSIWVIDVASCGA